MQFGATHKRRRRPPKALDVVRDLTYGVMADPPPRGPTVGPALITTAPTTSARTR